MPVTIKLNTLLANSINYFAGMTAERHSIPSGWGSSLDVNDLVRMDQYLIQQNGLVATLVFARVPAGEHFFCIRAADGRLIWRSPGLQVMDGNEQFSFHVLAVDLDATTLDSRQLTSGIQLPQVFDISGLDEDLRIGSLDLSIRSDRLEVDGEGEISKGRDWSLLQSDLSFAYSFVLQPTKSVVPDRFVKVVGKEELRMNLSNPLTGVGVFFVRDKVEAMIRKSVKNNVDSAVQAQLLGRTSGLSASQRSQVTATIGSIKIVRRGSPAIRKLQLAIDVSIPTAAIRL